MKGRPNPGSYCMRSVITAMNAKSRSRELSAQSIEIGDTTCPVGSLHLCLRNMRHLKTPCISGAKNVVCPRISENGRAERHQSQFLQLAIVQGAEDESGDCGFVGVLGMGSIRRGGLGASQCPAAAMLKR
jgi:hypothetical protein